MATFQQMDFVIQNFLMGYKWRRSEAKLSPHRLSRRRRHGHADVLFPSFFFDAAADKSNSIAVHTVLEIEDHTIADIFLRYD